MKEDVLMSKLILEELRVMEARYTEKLNHLENQIISIKTTLVGAEGESNGGVLGKVKDQEGRLKRVEYGIIAIAIVAGAAKYMGLL